MPASATRIRRELIIGVNVKETSKLTMMATAADYVIAEVEEIVELGELEPNCIHTSGIFVNAIFQGSNYEKRIERRTVRKR